MFPGFLNKRSKNKVKAAVGHRRCGGSVVGRAREKKKGKEEGKKIPVAAESLEKAADRLLKPPPHPDPTLSHRPDTPCPRAHPPPTVCLLCCGLDRAPTSDHHKHVGL